MSLYRVLPSFTLCYVHTFSSIHHSPFHRVLHTLANWLAAIFFGFGLVLVWFFALVLVRFGFCCFCCVRWLVETVGYPCFRRPFRFGGRGQTGLGNAHPLPHIQSKEQEVYRLLSYWTLEWRNSILRNIEAYRSVYGEVCWVLLGFYWTGKEVTGFYRVSIRSEENCCLIRLGMTRRAKVEEYRGIFVSLWFSLLGFTGFLLDG